MSIRPVDYNTMVQKIQELSKIKQIENDKPKNQLQQINVQQNNKIKRELSKVNNTKKSKETKINKDNKDNKKSKDKRHEKKLGTNNGKKKNKKLDIGNNIDIRI